MTGAGGNMPSATVPPDKTIFDLDIDAVKRVSELNLFGTIIPTMVFAKARYEQMDEAEIALITRSSCVITYKLSIARTL